MCSAGLRSKLNHGKKKKKKQPHSPQKSFTDHSRAEWAIIDNIPYFHKHRVSKWTASIYGRSARNGINQNYYASFLANGISLCLGEAEMKLSKRHCCKLSFPLSSWTACKQVIFQAPPWRFCISHPLGTLGNSLKHYRYWDQAQIHTGFHCFMEISHMFHNKYIINKINFPTRNLSKTSWKLTFMIMK